MKRLFVLICALTCFFVATYGESEHVVIGKKLELQQDLKSDSCLRDEAKRDSSWTRIMSVPRMNAEWIAHEKTWPVYAGLLLCLFAAFYVSVARPLASRDWEYMEQKHSWMDFLTIPVFLIISLLILYQIFGYQGDRVWFIIPNQIGWLMSILVTIFLLIPLMGGLLCSFFMPLALLDCISGRKNAGSIGNIGATLSFVTLIPIALSRLFHREDYEQYCVILFFAISVIQIIYMAFYHIKAKGNFLLFLFNVAFYLYGLFVIILFASSHIIIHIVIVMISFASVLATTPSKRSCCNCRVYLHQSGFCEYRQKLVDANDCCIKHQFDNDENNNNRYRKPYFKKASHMIPS